MYKYYVMTIQNSEGDTGMHHGQVADDSHDEFVKAFHETVKWCDGDPDDFAVVFYRVFEDVEIS